MPETFPDVLELLEGNGTTISLIPAEGVSQGDFILEGGPNCGVRTVWQVVDMFDPADDEHQGEVSLLLIDRYGEQRYTYPPGDQLILRVD